MKQLTRPPGTDRSDAMLPRALQDAGWRVDVDVPGWADASRLRGVESATTRHEGLPDGFWRVRVEHETLRAVTPGMLVWWYVHFPYLEVRLPDGQTLPAYRLWHPFDHRDFQVTRHALSGQLGCSRGALLDCDGFWGPYRRRSRLSVQDLDVTGLSARFVARGMVVAEFLQRFVAVADGTRCVSTLTVAARPGGERRPSRPRAFSRGIGRAWARHEIEATGNLQWLIPVLHAAMLRRDSGSRVPPTLIGADT